MDVHSFIYIIVSNIMARLILSGYVHEDAIVKVSMCSSIFIYTYIHTHTHTHTHTHIYVYISISIYIYLCSSAVDTVDA